MFNNRFKTIGILGGMGPLATLDLYNWIIKLTPTQKDQDHLPIIIHNLPQIPDRTSFILGTGENPLPYLVKSAKKLEKTDAKILALPCNTAHLFIDSIKDNLQKAEMVDMIFETKNDIERKFGTIQPRPKLGLLATTGTIKSNLYQKYFQNWGLLLPSNAIQEKIMSAIYGKKGIKNGYRKANQHILRQAIQHLHKKGATIVLLACTEIALVLKNEKTKHIHYVNPTKILAQALINKSSSK